MSENPLSNQCYKADYEPVHNFLVKILKQQIRRFR